MRNSTLTLYNASAPPDLPHPQSATLEIPFSVPPYMSLLARSVATLEGGLASLLEYTE